MVGKGHDTNLIVPFLEGVFGKGHDPNLIVPFLGAVVGKGHESKLIVPFLGVSVGKGHGTNIIVTILPLKFKIDFNSLIFHSNFSFCRLCFRDNFTISNYI